MQGDWQWSFSIGLFGNKLIHEYESDLRSNVHYLSSSENEASKNLGLHGI